MISQGLTSGLETQIANCLFNMPIWICNRHLKSHPPKLNSPMCVNAYFFFFTISSVPVNLRFFFPVAQNFVVKLNYVLSLKLPIKSIS